MLGEVGSAGPTTEPETSSAQPTAVRVSSGFSCQARLVARRWRCYNGHQPGGVGMAAKAGDRIIVESEKVGKPPRDGEILEVIASPLGARYRVRWADGQER